MPDIYVEIDRETGFAKNEDIQKAIDGFQCLDFKIIPFIKEDLLMGKYDSIINHNVFVAELSSMKYIFSKKGFINLDYPFLNTEYEYLHKRKIIKSNIEYLINMDIKHPIFIKSVFTKLFDGKIIKNNKQKEKFIKDNDFQNDESKNIEIYISDVFIDKIDVEMRFFIYEDDLCYYSPYYINRFNNNSIDFNYVNNLIKNFRNVMKSNTPTSYSIDIAILRNKQNILIEFNDFWSLGSYGMACEDYATSLKNRYFEIIRG